MKMEKSYDVQDIIDAEHSLEPLKCRLCGSSEVVFLQYAGDAICQDCGEWQNKKKYKRGAKQ